MIDCDYYGVEFHELFSVHFDGLIEWLELDVSGLSSVIHKRTLNRVQIVRTDGH